MAHGRAHARGPAGFDSRQTRLDRIVPAFRKALDVVVTNLVPRVGMKAGNGAGITELRADFTSLAS